MVVCFEDLFDVDPIPDNDAVKFLKNCRSKIWPIYYSPDFKESEKSVMLDVCSQILVPLTNEVIVERSYKQILKERPYSSLMFADIGIGSTKTWHGTPDARVRAGVNVLFATDDYNGDDSGEDSSDESDATTTLIEAKIQAKCSNLQQTVAMNVVSSFTEHNVHPSKDSAVPSLLFDKYSFIVTIYDCMKDLLLVSDKIPISRNGHFSQSGLTLLWVVLNHRATLKLPSEIEQFTSGIMPVLESTRSLPHFSSLKAKDINWYLASKPYTLGDDDDDEKVLMVPCAKRRRRK